MKYCFNCAYWDKCHAVTDEYLGYHKCLNFRSVWYNKSVSDICSCKHWRGLEADGFVTDCAWGSVEEDDDGEKHAEEY